MPSDNHIGRKSFLKQAGLIAGAGTAGLLFPGSFVGKINRKEAPKTLVPVVNDLTYWEMLMFSCLQGLANRDKPRVFLYFPEKKSESWDLKDEKSEKRIYYEWYKNYDFIHFLEVGNPYNLFEKLSTNDTLPFDGYVMIDTKSSISANIAANYASIENLLPVTQSILEDQKAHVPDLSVERDLRGQFDGMDKLEVYEWAYQHQWPKANHARVANLGTPDPAPADQLPVNSFFTSNRARDFTVAERGFFFDLNSNGKDYKLKDQILSEMTPHGYIFGWHQQAGETQHISQLSKHGQFALGASTYAANYSFYSRVKVPGAVERFKASVISNKDEKNTLEDKIYLTFALSDGDSLNFINRKTMGGQWQMPQRGQIPFGWEVQPLLADVAPGILDYYQATATENDYFVDGVSGIGYFYPEEMPKDVLRGVLAEVKKYLQRTGQSALTVMGPPSAVSEETAQTYQDILGEQLSGVMEGYTRRKADTVRLYRDEGGGFTNWLPTSNPQGDETIKNWVKGLKKVARTRTQRPLFIPIHVPAHQLTIADMKELMDRLGDEFEAVSPDAFYQLFAQARQNAVIINPPESFPSETIKLKNGTPNQLSIIVQNFSDDVKKINLKTKITSDRLIEVIVKNTAVKLEPNHTKKLSISLDVAENLKGSKGRIKYAINDKDPQISAPVQFT